MKKMIFLCLTSLLLLSGKAQEAGMAITYPAGEFFVSILSEGGRTANAGLLKNASAEQLAEYLPDGTFELEAQVFLVRAKGKNILIDTGYGRYLFDNLQKLGVSEEAIDAILLTHLHPDHTGGLLRNGQAAFPNAKVYLSEKEYEHWSKQSDGSAGIAALREYGERVGRFVPEAINSRGSELLPGIRAIEAYGHTPGHTAFLIQSEDAQWLIWGDVAHAMPIQMPCPEVGLAFDSDLEQAVRTRKDLLDYAAKNQMTIGGMHIPFPAVGKLSVGKAASNRGFVFTPLCLCEGF
ncbi:MAG: MBL fold metallo-hydrolase [Tannerellaceae bacterium]|jgi:glyoxylase-like metal-dependent hydrolase (beta-lactamase superfamily II)|nr:MBL fold metallo-hydrolase [Tannerellaceae bacterium]